MIGEAGGGPEIVQLEVSAWTRRERVERIAAAERDRRAGREALALAALGGASEWPARLVVALAKLPAGEGAETRTLLEATLDDWAAENGLSLAEPVSRAETTETETATEVEAETGADADVALEVADEDEAHAGAETPDSDPFVEADRRAAALDAPIDFDELEQAFAAAEVDPDEMLDVNTVAERVLFEEPLGVDGLEEAGEDAAAARPVLDAAFAEAPIWPEPLDPSFDALPFEQDASDFAGAARAEAAEPESRATRAAAPDDPTGVAGRSSRPVVVATLERWLVNLENQRRRRAR